MSVVMKMCWNIDGGIFYYQFFSHIKMLHERNVSFTFREFCYSLLHAKIGLNCIIKQFYFACRAGRVLNSLPCSSSCIQLRTTFVSFFSSFLSSKCFATLVKQTVAKLISVKLQLNWFFSASWSKQKFFVAHKTNSLCGSVNRDSRARG